MKKFLALMTSAVLVLCLAGCTQKAEPAPSPATQPSATPVPSSAAPSSAAPASEAPAYSANKMTVFATFDVGGGVDTFGRNMSAMLNNTGLWKGAFIYENVGGASGQVGLTQICEQYEGDESYILPTSDNVLQVAYVNKMDKGYGFRELTPVARLYCEYRVYVTSPKTGIKSLEDLIELSKTKDIIGSTSGNGGASHIAIAGLAAEMGIDIRCVPYGGGEDIVATLAGESHIGALGSNEALQYLKSGDLIALAIAAPEPLDINELKDIPICKSLGYDCEFGTSRGWTMPAGVSKEAVDYWANLFKQMSETQEFKDYVRNAGGTIAYLGPEDFVKANEEQTAQTISILERIGFYNQKK